MRLPRSKRNLLLPAAAAGLAVVLPWRAIELAQGWSAYAADRPAETAVLPAPPVQPAAMRTQVPPTAPAAAQKTPVPAACEPDLAAMGQAGSQTDAGLVAEVAHRTAELDKRENALTLRETQLAAASQLVSKQMAELERMRQTVEALVVHETTASAADMKLLVGLYSNMKPVQAAAVLGKLAPPKAAEILQNLSTRMAGPILAAMDPAAAVKVTDELEQRHAAFRQ